MDDEVICKDDAWKRRYDGSQQVQEGKQKSDLVGPAQCSKRGDGKQYHNNLLTVHVKCIGQVQGCGIQVRRICGKNVGCHQDQARNQKTHGQQHICQVAVAYRNGGDGPAEDHENISAKQSGQGRRDGFLCGFRVAHDVRDAGGGGQDPGSDHDGDPAG